MKGGVGREVDGEETYFWARTRGAMARRESLENCILGVLGDF